MSRAFWKMTGSGNDFVVLDSRGAERDPLETPEAIQRLSARGTGVGADGVVFIADTGDSGATLGMRYYNSDGSRGAFCGNATLCVTRLAHRLRLADGEMVIKTDSGLIPARMGPNGPEIDLPAAHDIVSSVAALTLEAGESRIGYAVAGVPHFVVRCASSEEAPVELRGRELRHSEFRPGGANVNFVSRGTSGWSIRTFERGVEGETLACGSGAIASAILLAMWNDSGESASLMTRSGRVLTVRLRREGECWMPSLSGEGRVVFTGALAE